MLFPLPLGMLVLFNLFRGFNTYDGVHLPSRAYLLAQHNVFSALSFSSDGDCPLLSAAFFSVGSSSPLRV